MHHVTTQPTAKPTMHTSQSAQSNRTMHQQQNTRPRPPQQFKLTRSRNPNPTNHTQSHHQAHTPLHHTRLGTKPDIQSQRPITTQAQKHLPMHQSNQSTHLRQQNRNQRKGTNTSKPNSLQQHQLQRSQSHNTDDLRNHTKQRPNYNAHTSSFTYTATPISLRQTLQPLPNRNNNPITVPSQHQNTHHPQKTNQ